MRRVLPAAVLAALLVAVAILACLPDQPAAAPAEPRLPVLFLRREPLDDATRATGEALLQRMRRRWSRDHDQAMKDAAAGRGRCGTPSGHLFFDEREGYFQEIRLFALGYPEVAAAWAASAMQPGVGLERERWIAQVMQTWLWKAGWAGADEPIVRLCREAPSHEYSDELWLLAAGDASGKHRPLYREMARQGHYYALEALTFWADPAVVELFHGSPDYRDLLPRVEALNSGTWPERVKRLLRAPGAGDELRWALRIAVDRRPPWLEGLLRERTALGRTEVGYDEALLSLAAIGAKLTADEKTLLRRNGYACEPRAQLLDLLREKNYAP